MLPGMNMAEGGATDVAPDEAPPGADLHPPAWLADTPGLAADLATPHGCPFLLAANGGWRLAVPSRDHRCAAVNPPAALSPEKQSRLCLTSGHTSCATYLASMSARGTRLGSQAMDPPTRWGLTRTTTVIEDAGGLRSRVVGLMLDRRRWPAIPAVLLVVTLLVLAVSGLRGGGIPGATDSPTGPAITARPSVQPSAPPTAAPTASPEPEATPTSRPTAAPSPTAVPSTPKPTFQTYRVVSGDTLSGIAARFGTTPQAIANLNGILLNSTLRVGQILKIPNP
jgi:LysM domain